MQHPSSSGIFASTAQAILALVGIESLHGQLPSLHLKLLAGSQEGKGARTKKAVSYKETTEHAAPCLACFTRYSSAKLGESHVHHEDGLV